MPRVRSLLRFILLPVVNGLLPAKWRPPAATSTEARVAWIGSCRRLWFAALDPYGNTDYLFPPAPELEPRHLERCQLVPNREFMVRECLPKNAVVAEVGTFRGQFAEVILSSTHPKELHLIDINLSRFERAPFEAALSTGQLFLYEQDSVEALAAFPDAYFDWIYIDANHSYCSVKRDIAVASRKVKQDGLLVFNDYVFWSHGELLHYGVVQAVNELCIEDGWEFRFFALHGEMVSDVAVSRLPAQAEKESGGGADRA